ncbi:SET domain-containing protein [Mycena amicta]|nr:SET domain-containing protein [Mycena amicta]
MDGVLSWFTGNGGTIDSSSVGFTDFADAGRGVVALRNIPEGHVLFKIPRSILLSTETSSLPQRVGLDQWRARKLHVGWAGLILCMMWETAQGRTSKWAPYLESLPTTFNTPMFWSDDELEELRGTSVVEKLGKTDAERDFTEKVLPLVQSRPDIFTPDTIASFYTLELYHIMGSRILSRSFDVEKDESEEENENEAGNTSLGSAMDVDEQGGQPAAESIDAHEHEQEHDTEAEGADDDDGEDDSVVVCMVPLADMLNAQYGSENAKLFYEKDSLGMRSTKPIKAHEQILNTYGDLPNAELLRRYGHVDLLALPEDSSHGNPGDVVEIRADIVVARIDWWLEQGGDEYLPPLAALIRLLRLNSDEWAQAVSKDKVPKPKLDAEVLGVVVRVLERRLNEYPTMLTADLELAGTETIPLNKKHALAVRIGEKRILQQALEKVRERIEAEAQTGSGGNGKKRKAGENADRSSKRKR